MHDDDLRASCFAALDVLCAKHGPELPYAGGLDAGFAFDPDLITEVEVAFEPEGTGSRVTLTHRHLERFGPSAERIAGQLAGGWPGLVERFANYVQEENDA